MTTSWKILGQVELTGAGTQDAVYTVPANTEADIKHIVAVNHDGSDRTLTMWVDGTADANLILPATTILAGGHAENADVNILLEAAKVIYAEASAATAITVTIFGIEVT